MTDLYTLTQIAEKFSGLGAAMQEQAVYVGNNDINHEPNAPMYVNDNSLAYIAEYYELIADLMDGQEAAEQAQEILDQIEQYRHSDDD